MNITSELAEKIITEIQTIVGHKINIMNREGIILASSNPSRVGTYHSAAKYMIDNQLSILEIQDTLQFNDVKPGINLTILYEGEVIGVIGITGDSNEVKDYGLIIKKMTELLIRQVHLTNNLKTREFEKSEFLLEWINSDLNTINDQFYQRGLYYNINIRAPKSIIVLFDPSVSQMPSASQVLPASQVPSASQLPSASQVPSATLLTEVSYETHQTAVTAQKQWIHTFLKNHIDCVTLKHASYFIVVCEKIPLEKFRLLLTQLQKGLEEKFKSIWSIGACYNAGTEHGMNSSFHHALQALSSSSHTPNWGYTIYEDMDLELFSHQVTGVTKELFIQKIFSGIPEESLESVISTISAYIDANGSIEKCADQLYIHKNTLQNKLNKISKITGYNPRDLKHLPLFYIAISFYHDLINNRLK
jgi:carbohydrate diacid regulator